MPVRNSKKRNRFSGGFAPKNNLNKVLLLFMYAYILPLVSQLNVYVSVYLRCM